MDFSKISTPDLQAIQAQQWDKASTPGLQEYQNQRKQQAAPPNDPADAMEIKQGGPEQSKLMTYVKQGLGAFQALRGGLIKGASLGNLDPSTMGPTAEMYSQSMSEHPIASGVGQLGGGAATGAAVGELAAGGTIAGNGLKAALSRIGANTGAGGALGFLRKPSEGEDRVSNAETGMALGAGASTAGEAVGAVARPVADHAMKWSAGIRKAPEGLGNSLAEQGLWGTQSRMLNQVESKLPDEERNLQELVGQLKGNVDAKDIADAVSEHGKRFVSPSGLTINSVKPDLDKVRDAAEQFQSMGEGGELTPQDLLSLKRQGDWAGYAASGNPASATDAEIGRAIADKSRSLLSEMSEGGTADTLKREQALIYAKKALERDPTTHQGVGSTLFFGKAPASGLIGSTVGQAAQKTNDAVTDPKVLQSLFGAAAQGR